jgi:hypothetical protein
MLINRWIMLKCRMGHELKISENMLYAREGSHDPLAVEVERGAAVPCHVLPAPSPTRA